MSHAAPWPDAQQAARQLVKWIAKQGFSKDNNYTVAVYNRRHLVITKVAGITIAAAGAQEIARYIFNQKMHVGRTVYLAQAFATKDGPNSNHAEMCILAACGPENVTYIECTSNNCRYCKLILGEYDIVNANADGDDGAVQQGWIHPFLGVRYGTQLKGGEAAHLKELEQIHRSGTLDGLVYGQPPVAVKLQHGRLTPIDFSNFESSSEEMSEDDADGTSDVDDTEMSQDSD